MSENENISPEYRPTLVTESNTAAAGNGLSQDEKQVGKSLKKNVHLSEEELDAVNSREGLLKLLDTKKVNVKKKARLESMRHVLSALEFEGKNELDINLYPDPEIVVRYHRSGNSID
jgi:hypothetical protein